ncbi:MAG: hypothetical protein DRG20_07025 [Deltaproteobacteria bacterium]|nr:MAG: hypothetical protein DRG20_07025 [Deltaproteobacteria bacterium]
MKKIRKIVFDSLVIIFISLYVFVPIVAMILHAFAEKWYAWHWWFPQKLGFKWFKDPMLLGEIPRAFFFSYTIAIVVSLVTLIITFSAGYVLATKEFKGRNIMDQIANLPFAFPAIVLGIALLPIYSRIGLLRTYWGVILVHMVGAIPYTLRAVIGSFRSIPPEMEEAARNLGATKFVTLYKIYLPLTWPGLIAGAIFAFTWSLNEFVLTLLLGFPTIFTLPVNIAQYMGEYFLSPQRAAVLGLFLLIPTVASLLIAEKYLTPESMGGGLG